MWIVLALIFIVCVYSGFRYGLAQTDMGAALLIWLLLTPAITTIMMSAFYYFIYGFGSGIWFMLFPLLFPFLVGGLQKITDIEYQHVYKKHTEPIRKIVRSHIADKFTKRVANELQINVVYRDIYKHTIFIRKQSEWRLDVWVYPIQGSIKDTLYLNKKELETLVTSSLKEHYGEVTFAIKFEYNYLKAHNASEGV